MKARQSVIFYLNGVRQEVSGEATGMMLADYLRDRRQLTGTKIVCAEGDCGACSVLRFFPSESQAQFLPINSCIMTVAQMDGSSLVTVEALRKSDGELSPVQAAMVGCHGSQCGFCTPGFVVALTGLVEKKLQDGAAAIAPQEAKNACTGNLCRCTGYQPIIDAAVSIEVAKCDSVKDRFYSKSQGQDLLKALRTPLHIETPRFSFFAPRSLKDAAKYLAKNRDARLINASTDLGVVHNKGKIRLSKLVSLHLIPELYQTKAGKGRMLVGARVTLTSLRDAVKKPVPEFARFLDLFASPQIKNVATLIGNVGNASPIADTPPFLLAAQATVHIQGPRAKRKVPFDRFYLGYRKTALKPGELIAAIEFDLPGKHESLSLYKVSQRKDLDISAVNAAFRILWTDSKKTKVKAVRLAMGGVAATPLRLPKTESVLKGATLSPEIIDQAVAKLHSEMQPLSDLRGTTAFRRVLVENLFRKFFRESGATVNGGAQ